MSKKHRGETSGMVNVDINGGSIPVFLDQQSSDIFFSYFHPLVTHLSLSLNNDNNNRSSRASKNDQSRIRSAVIVNPGVN